MRYPTYDQVAAALFAYDNMLGEKPCLSDRIAAMRSALAVVLTSESDHAGPVDIAKKLVAITDWLRTQDSALSRGLRSTGDAEKLYDYWMKHKLPPLYCDDKSDPHIVTPSDTNFSLHRTIALGYDPLTEK